MSSAITATMSTSIRPSFLGSKVELLKGPDAAGARLTMRVGPRIASSVSVWKGEAERLEAVSARSGRSQFSFLVGEYPDECGWRSSGLSVDPETFAKTTALEVIHARWAMLGVVACLVPETASRILQSSHLASSNGSIGSFTLGSSILNTTTNFIGSCNLCTVESILAIGAFQLLCMTAVEGFRVAGGPLGDASGSVYPGGLFDPLGFADSSNASELAKLKAKELQNGRLAMFAIMGFAAQAAVTGKGPVENLMEHMADPKVQNAWAYAESLFQ
ncbi:hypothetical protein CLOP_g17029 [Closterium sp. NIES-67]|nr:hypothetical protein CLOP_g6322 [Closterium sp. NIES-67]GJP87057.1 hypothetical protein CLOP_g17029 [Closterium sp. NIES-67]